MRKLAYFSVVWMLAAILFVGCGKPAEQLKQEKDLASEITKVHDELMTVKLDDYMSQVADCKVKCDTMASKMKAAKKAMPDSTLSADLGASGDKLKAAKEAMNTWMANHKPYDEKLKHEEAMTMLNAQKEELMKVKGDIDAAKTSAETAIERFKKAESTPAGPAKPGGPGAPAGPGGPGAKPGGPKKL